MENTMAGPAYPRSGAFPGQPVVRQLGGANISTEASVAARLQLVEKTLLETKVLLGNALASLRGPTPQENGKGNPAPCSVMTLVEDLVSESGELFAMANELRDKIGG